MVRSNLDRIEAAGMNIEVKQIEPKLLGVRVSEEEIMAFLADRRTVSVPLAWSWRLVWIKRSYSTEKIVFERQQGV
jgi:hypothetical protein